MAFKAEIPDCQMINRKVKEKNGENVVSCRVMFPGGAEWCSFPVAEDSKIPALGSTGFVSHVEMNPGMNAGTYEIGKFLGFSAPQQGQRKPEQT